MIMLTIFLLGKKKKEEQSVLYQCEDMDNSEQNLFFQPKQIRSRRNFQNPDMCHGHFDFMENMI